MFGKGKALHYTAACVAFISAVLSQNTTVCDEETFYTFIPDVHECNAWFFCGVNGPVRGVCPKPYLFNSRTRLCDWPQNVDCFQCPSTVGLQEIPRKGSCRTFVRCINGAPSQNVCEVGLQLNLVTGQCDLESIVQCKRGLRCPDQLPTDGSIIAIRDNLNCSVYYACIGDAEATRQECNSQLHYDPIKGLCTFPNYTDCSVNKSRRSPENGPGNPESEPIELQNEYPSEWLTIPPIEAMSHSPEDLFYCSYDGIHAHPTERRQYYVCIADLPHLMKCADGFHFDVSTLQCALTPVVN